MYQIEHQVMVAWDYEPIIWYPSEYVQLYHDGKYEEWIDEETHAVYVQVKRFDTLHEARNAIRKSFCFPRMKYRILDLETNQVYY